MERGEGELEAAGAADATGARGGRFSLDMVRRLSRDFPRPTNPEGWSAWPQPGDGDGQVLDVGGVDGGRAAVPFDNGLSLSDSQVCGFSSLCACSKVCACVCARAHACTLTYIKA